MNESRSLPDVEMWDGEGVHNTICVWKYNGAQRNYSHNVIMQPKCLCRQSQWLYRASKMDASYTQLAALCSQMSTSGRQLLSMGHKIAHACGCLWLLAFSRGSFNVIFPRGTEHALQSWQFISEP